MKSFVFISMLLMAFAANASWNITESLDKMTGKTSFHATVSSEETLNLGFPYSGSQRATLTVRLDPKYGTDIIFQISKGQLLCHESGMSYGQCHITIRVDDKPMRKIQMSTSADNDSTVLFVSNPKPLLNEMLKAKKILISPIIYTNGSPVLTFDISGLALPTKATGRK